MFNKLDQITDCELLGLNNGCDFDSRDLLNAFKKRLNNVDNEIRIIEYRLTEFSVRSASLLAVAGLFTLLPIADQLQKQFLVAVHPFLIVSIVIFALSLSRSLPLLNSFPTVPDNHKSELGFVRTELKLKSQVWKLMQKQHHQILQLQRLIHILVFLYFNSFIFNFILFEYFGILLPAELFLYIFTVIGMHLYLRNIISSKKVCISHRSFVIPFNLSKKQNDT